MSERGGGALNVERRGSGPPLVCLHGWAMNLRVFDGLAAGLADAHEVITLDLPGHGRSAWHDAFDSFDAWVDAVAAQLPARCTLLGWSLGGQLAIELAARLPGRVEKLVLVSTTPCFVGSDEWPQGLAPEVFVRFRDELARDPRRCVADFLDLQLRGSAGADAARASLAQALATQGEAEPRALRTGLALLEHDDLRRRAAALRLPLLVIAGEHDRITPPAASEWLAAQVPHARLHVLRRAAHLPFVSHAAEVLALLRPFLAAPRDPYALDVRAVARSFGRASESYDGAAMLQAEVRAELLARAQEMKLAPARILDLGSGTGAAAAELKRRHPKALVCALDSATGMLHAVQRRSHFWRPLRLVAADAQRLPFTAGAFDLVFSNLMLQWCDPDLVFAEVRRVLSPGGLFVFASFGPDTLIELREAWARVDAGTHVSRFPDLPDLGDALMRNGLAEPVLDVERRRVQHSSVDELMRGLKAIGAGNRTAGRARGLTGRHAFAAMAAVYEEHRRDGKLPASYEVVYGAAWGSGPAAARGAQVVPGETRVPLSALRPHRARE